MNNRQRQYRKLHKGPRLSVDERLNLRDTLAIYIASCLRQFLAKKLYGYPQSLATFKEDGEPSRCEAEVIAGMSEAVKKMTWELYYKEPPFNPKEEISLEIRQWRDILGQMLWSFEQIADGFSRSPLSVWNEEQLKKGFFFEFEEHSEYGAVLLKDTAPETPEQIREEDRKYHEKVQHGLNLFAQYFLDLFD